MGLVNYFKESYSELTNHVTWPTWSEAQRDAITVAVFSVIFALIIWGIDSVFSNVITNYFTWIKNS